MGRRNSFQVLAPHGGQCWTPKRVNIQSRNTCKQAIVPEVGSDLWIKLLGKGISKSNLALWRVGCVTCRDSIRGWLG
jgi:hypothetical protein